MVEKKDLIGMSAITILLITTLLGLVPAAQDTHICIEGNITMPCDHLSPTDRTCYPAEDTTIGKKLCAGVWKPIDRSDVITDVTTVQIELNAGGFIECNVVDGIVRQDCYFDGRNAFRSEFE